jgi:hypothetical protein
MPKKFAAQFKWRLDVQAPALPPRPRTAGQHRQTKRSLTIRSHVNQNPYAKSGAHSLRRYRGRDAQARLPPPFWPAPFAARRHWRSEVGAARDAPLARLWHSLQVFCWADNARPCVTARKPFRSLGMTVRSQGWASAVERLRLGKRRTPSEGFCRCQVVNGENGNIAVGISCANQVLCWIEGAI